MHPRRPPPERSPCGRSGIAMAGMRVRVTFALAPGCPAPTRAGREVSLAHVFLLAQSVREFDPEILAFLRRPRTAHATSVTSNDMTTKMKKSSLDHMN